MRRLQLGLGLLIVGLVGASASCGRHDLLPGDQSLNEGLSVKGVASLGTLCPYGSLQDPTLQPLRLWDCPVSLNEAEFMSPPKPLIFSVDCTKNTMNVRSPDRSVDFMVEIRPDHSFSAIGEGSTAVLKADAQGASECTAYMQLDVRGTVNCQDRDRAQINLDAFWWPALGVRPPSAVGRMGRVCALPTSCYFYTGAQLDQCK